MLSEERLREKLARATTEEQRAKMLVLANRGKDVYPEARQGKGVVAEFRRYCETRDPEKIGKGLYHFSTMGAGGLNDIAHFNLHGFRAEYPHPVHYIQRLLVPEMQRNARYLEDDPRFPGDCNGFHSHYVYTDGMTAAEVSMAIMELAAKYGPELKSDWYMRRNTRVLSEASELAESIGMKVVPA
jgi:hypothetical protein